MSFPVVFYTFTKKGNSTARPSGSGSSYNCTAKVPMSVTAPRLQLQLANGASANPSAWNYAYIAAFGRYYHVTEWTNAGPLWEAALAVDSLASWKTELGALSLYVFRSSTAYNLRLTDTLYPQLVTPHRIKVTLPKVWTIGGANDPGNSKNACSIVAGIVSGNSTKFYAFSPAEWDKFYSALFSQNYYNAVLGEFGALEYPEAKVAINPLQYIASAIMIPWGIGALRFQIDYVATVSTIKVGNADVTGSPYAFTAYRLYDEPQDPWTWYVEIGNDFWHPQADERGDWLNYAPNSEYMLFFPPVGEIPLEPAIVAGAEYIRFYLYTDYKSGSGMLEVIADYGSNKQRILCRTEFALGASIQLSNVMTAGTSWSGAEWVRENVSGVGADIVKFAANLPVVGGAIEKGIQSAIHGATPHMSTSGRFSSLATMGGTPRIDVTHWYMAPDDLNGRGRPLCDMRQISAIPGYIVADPDEVSLPCTATELSAIQSAVRSGFYYE